MLPFHCLGLLLLLLLLLLYRDIKSAFDSFLLRSDINTVSSVVYVKLYENKRLKNQSYFLFYKNKLAWF